jgi:hypothetical protein
MPVCKLYLLFISADAANGEEKEKKSAAACWCFKVCSPYSSADEAKFKFSITENVFILNLTRLLGPLFRKMKNQNQIFSPSVIVF